MEEEREVGGERRGFLRATVKTQVENLGFSDGAVWRGSLTYMLLCLGLVLGRQCQWIGGGDK